MRKILAAAIIAVMFFAQMGAALATDCGGTAGVAASTIFSTSNVRGFFIVNNSANLMCLSFDQVATIGGTNCPAGSYPLAAGTATAAGGSFLTPQGYAPTAPSIIAGGASSAYSCTRW